MDDGTLEMRVGWCSLVTRVAQDIQRLDQEARSKRLPANLLFGLIIFGLLVACAILGLIWTPYNPNAQNFAAQLKSPSLQHLLGGCKAKLGHRATSVNHDNGTLDCGNCRSG